MRRALLVVAMLGCSNNGGSGYLPIDQAAAAFKRAFCDYAVRCGQFPDATTCIGASLGFNLRVDPSEIAAIGAGKVIYDGNKAAQCYDAYGARSCDRTSQDARAFPAVCNEAIRGTVAGNAACAVASECVSGNCNVPTCTMACCMGTCVGDTPPVRDVAIGQSCAGNVAASCATGAYCDGATVLCAALKPGGATCTSSNECGYELSCVGTTTRTCTALPQLGQACPDGQCRDDGTYCNATMVCAKVGLPSDPCATGRDCSTYYTCDATSHCARGPAIGGACSATARCFDDGTLCDATAMTCAALHVDGGACTSNSQCLNNFCDATTSTCMTKAVCI